MKRLLALFFLLFAASGAPSASGQEFQGIAAVVNDDVISMFDLETRMKLTIAALGLEDTLSTRDQIRPQALRMLIKEKLQIQEAEKLNINVSDSELEKTIRELEKRNRVWEGGFEEHFKNKGIEPSTVIAQIRADLSWTKLLNQRLRPQINVGKEEVDEVLALMERNKGKPEYLVAEIFLSVDSPEQDEEVRRTAGQIIERLRRGKSFPQLARQFSQSAAAGGGGDIGWIQPGQLDEKLEAILKQMPPHQITEPIRTLSGYHILLLRDKRIAGREEDATVSMRQIFFSFPLDASQEHIASLSARAESLSQGVSGCEAMAALKDESGADLSLDLGTLVVDDLPPNLQEIATTIEIGVPSAPILTKNGVMVLMVCQRSEPRSVFLNREKITKTIESKRLDLLARRYLRDLKRAAHIDIRTDSAL